MCKIVLILPPYLPHRIRGNPKDTRIIQLKKRREGKGLQQTSNWVPCCSKVGLAVVREH